MKKAFIKIVASLTIVFGFWSVRALAQERSQVQQLSTVLTELKNQLELSSQIISNKDSSPLERGEAINTLFENLGNACVQNCDTAVNILSDFNNKFPANVQKASIANFTKGFTDRALSDQLLDKVIAPLNLSKKFEEMYNKNPEAFKVKIQASIQVVQAIVNFEQEAVFKALSADPQQKSEGIAELKKDLGYMIRQGQALMQIKSQFSQHSKGQPWTESDAQIIAKAIDDLGFFYIKLAQSVSNLADVLPEEILNSLKMFQDQLPPLSPEQAEQILREELGADPYTIFKDIDFAKPISTGSIAVVYEAKVKNFFGLWTDVIVKVQRPGLKETLDYNRKLNRLLLQFVKIAGKQASPFLEFLGDQVLGLEDAFEGELDFTKEARNMQRFANLFRFNPNVKVPSAYTKYSTKKILVVEKVKGANLEKSLKKVVDKLKLNESEDSVERESLKKTYTTIFENMVYMLVVSKELHADLHPGNMLAVLEEEDQGVRLNEKLAMLDYGQTTQTKGFVWVPLMAGYHLMMGNAEGFAKRFMQMGINPSFEKELLVEAVKKIFAESGIEQVALHDVIRKKAKVNMGEKLIKALGEIVKVAFKDLGFRGNPRYVQVVRSFLPVGSSLILIGKNLKGSEILKLSMGAFGRGVSLGSLYYVSAIIPNAISDLKFSLIDALNSQNVQEQNTGSSGRCEAVFF
ncbi:MAG: AarF/UbiB family protein [Pseudobdellovibrionaceae bacterium]